MKRNGIGVQAAVVMSNVQQAPPTGLTAPYFRFLQGCTWAGLIALSGIVLWEYLGWDRWLLHVWGGANGFPLSHQWWMERVFHNGGRIMAAILLMAQCVDIGGRWLPGGTRKRRFYWTLVTVLGLLVVPTIKRYSATSCPWDIVEFGGTVPYIPHWLLRVSDHGSGHCFPSGHAVSAFAFFSLVFLMAPFQRRLAGIWAMVVVVFGLLFGIVQMARGAHYLSHVLWSGWLCWCLAGIMAALEVLVVRLRGQRLTQ